jgi:hypothetical protein
MSSDEEMAVRGRMMTEFADAKRHMATLHAEAERIGKLIYYVGACIQHASPHHSAGITEEHLAALDGPKVKSLLEDIKQTDEKINTLRERLTALGLLG